MQKKSTSGTMLFIGKPKYRKFIFLLFLTIVLVGCNTTKFVQEGEYLLDKVSMKIDRKDLEKRQMQSYIRQTPNAAVFNLWRMQLDIYNLASRDTSKRLSRFLRKIGDPPVIYDQSYTDFSTQQLKQTLYNKGYYNAEVSSYVSFKKKKASVTYTIKANKPYRLSNYDYQLNNQDLNKIAGDSSKSYIRNNMIFNSDVLNSERDRIASTFRRQGHYYFGKDYLTYLADSSFNNHRVDLTLKLHSNITDHQDSINNIIFSKYTIRKVIYKINSSTINTSLNEETSETLDTIRFRDFELISPKTPIITIDALVQNTFINPNSLYNDGAMERTYQSLNSLGPIKYVNISYTDAGGNMLDCHINIVPAKTISFSTEAEGTYTAGYWGLATNLNITNKNLFKKAEVLSLQIREAFEKQDSTFWAQEFAVQANLKFPKFVFPLGSYDFKRNIHANTELTGMFSYQTRPKEFTTTNAGIGWAYSWNLLKYRHVFHLIDFNFVTFPSIDSKFRNLYLSKTSPIFNPYNYTDHLILRMGYSGSYSSFNSSRPLENYSTMRYSLETAGNSLFGLSKLFHAKINKNGDYRIFNVRYAQYIKAEYNVTRHQIFDPQNRIVYHLGVGLGVPYGNSDELPYEKRFYSGGANSIRGWGESTLGPGSYKRITENSRDFNQVGDIKLETSLEYRTKLFWIIEGAAFIDAGNIWTIQNYETQPDGVLKLNSFYKQIALAYGVGLRFDISFFILRVDLGLKLYDPAPNNYGQWRLPPNKISDYALHFAIGYPF